MILFNLAIYEGDAVEIKFNTVNELIDYIQTLKEFNCIWIATEECMNEEILVTESIDKIIKAIETDFFNLCLHKDSLFFMQEYQSYEDAYSVALSMREGNIKCYNA